jgi:hypothetical protein
VWQDDDEANPGTARALAEMIFAPRSEPSMPAAKRPAISLVEPTLAGLSAYGDALARGWSPDSERDASAERLTALLLDPMAFLRDITFATGPARRSCRTGSRGISATRWCRGGGAAAMPPAPWP